MKYELKALEDLINKLRDNHTLKNAQDNIRIIEQEAKRTKQAIIHLLLLQKNETLLNTCFTIHILKLIEISDQLFDMTGNDTEHPGTLAILNLIGALKKAVPNLISRDIALPKAFRVIQGKQLAAEWLLMTDRLANIGAGTELIEIAGLPFEEFASLKIKLSWFHYTWLKQYLAELATIDFTKFDPYPSPEHLIHECLIRLDFNHPRFMAYCCKVIQQSADQYKSEELLILNMTKKLIGQFNMLSGESFYPKQQNIVKELYRWIDKEIEFRQVYDMAVFEAEGKKVPVNPYKYIYDMTLEQLAFWKKLQFDHKVFAIDNLETLSVKIAYNSSTKNKEVLSVGSITSKLYSKDSKVISPIYELVVAMFMTIQPIIELLQKMMEDLKPFMA